MKSFIEFLMEEMVDFYHRTDATSALNIQKNGVRASGLSVFLDPKQAADYEGAKSNDFVPKGSPTITGKVSTSQMIPDMEMHPGAFNKVYGEMAKQDRVPSLSRTSQTPIGNFQYNIPGIRYNKETGKLEPGYGIVYSSDGQTFRKAHEIDLNDPSQHPYIDTRSQIQVGPKGKKVLPVDKPIKIGGSTNQGEFGFKELGDLDKITSKSGPVSKKNITSKFLQSPVERKALRTTSNVQVSPKMSFSDKKTGVNSYFNYDNKTGNAYWGYQVPDGKGGHTDIPPEGLSPEAKSGMSRAARDQMTRYRKANPGTNITSQYNPGAQGEANWKFWQGEDAKLKATNPEITGSFTRSGISTGLASVGAAALGGVVSGALGAGTNAAAAAYQHRTTDEKMPMEKSMQSDMGLMWDKVPGESGELQGNPAGFKAARDREKKTGVPYPTYHDWSN